MQPTHEIGLYLESVPAELRNLIISVASPTTEATHSRGFSYYDEPRGGPVKGGICQTSLERDHVRLACVYGAFPPDPKRLLEGPASYKRYVRLYSYEQALWDDWRDLITASAGFGPYTLSPR